MRKNILSMFTGLKSHLCSPHLHIDAIRQHQRKGNFLQLLLLTSNLGKRPTIYIIDRKHSGGCLVAPQPRPSFHVHITGSVRFRISAKRD